MSQSRHSLTTQSIRSLRRQFVQAPGLPFSKILSRKQVESALQEEHLVYRIRLYSPVVTLWVFLSQVLSPDHSCREAVSRLVAYLAAGKQRPCSARTVKLAEFARAVTAKLGNACPRACWRSWCVRPAVNSTNRRLQDGAGTGAR
mgnify:CR=1 FL=1